MFDASNAAIEKYARIVAKIIIISCTIINSSQHYNKGARV